MKYDPKIRAMIEKIVTDWYSDPDLGYPGCYSLTNCIQGAHGECAAMIYEFGLKEGFKQWYKVSLEKRKTLGKNKKTRDEYDFRTQENVPVDVKSIQFNHKKLIVNYFSHRNHMYEEFWVVQWNETGDDFDIIKIPCAEFDRKSKRVDDNLEMYVK
jgi:hypothetical protein